VPDFSVAVILYDLVDQIKVRGRFVSKTGGQMDKWKTTPSSGTSRRHRRINDVHCHSQKILVILIPRRPKQDCGSSNGKADITFLEASVRKLERGSGRCSAHFRFRFTPSALPFRGAAGGGACVETSVLLEPRLMPKPCSVPSAPLSYLAD